MCRLLYVVCGTLMQPTEITYICTNYRAAVSSTSAIRALKRSTVKAQCFWPQPEPGAVAGRLVSVVPTRHPESGWERGVLLGIDLIFLFAQRCEAPSSLSLEELRNLDIYLGGG